MQGNYSLLGHQEEREMIKSCNETEVGLIPWGTLNTGHLARSANDQQTTIRAKGKELTAHDIAIIDRVEEMANKKGIKMSQIALAWINLRVSSPMSSFSSVERLD
jgi:aryl-alcohol dehydrogenase-like predicted oxidoreductase